MGVQTYGDNRARNSRLWLKVIDVNGRYEVFRRWQHVRKRAEWRPEGFFFFSFPRRRGRIMASRQRRPPRAHAPVAAAILRTWQRGGPRENIGKQGQAAAATTSWVGNSGGSVRRRPGTIPPLAPAGRTAHRDGQRTEIVKRCHGQISRPLQYRKAMRCSASAEYLPRSAPSVTSDLPTLRESSKSDARIACNHDQRPWLA